MDIYGQLKNLHTVAWRLHQIQEALRICGNHPLADILNGLSQEVTANVDFIKEQKSKGVKRKLNE